MTIRKSTEYLEKDFKIALEIGDRVEKEELMEISVMLASRLS